VLAFRPKTRHPSIKGAYFVGASTHPGTGVPICLAGARITTEQILSDFGIPFPWPKFGTVRQAKSEQAQVGYLDQKHLATPWMGGQGLVALIALVLGLLLTMYIGRV
jgi:phytoene desaturase (3,4-didehydrolycopene-forming)